MSQGRGTPFHLADKIPLCPLCKVEPVLAERLGFGQEAFCPVCGLDTRKWYEVRDLKQNLNRTIESSIALNKRYRALKEKYENESSTVAVGCLSVCDS